MLWLGVAGSMTYAAPPEDDHTNPSWYRTANGDKQPVTTPEHWAVRRQEIVTRMQEVMGPLPDRTKWPEAQVRVLERKEIDGGLVRQKIQFVTDSADRPVKAWVFLPAETAKVPERRQRSCACTRRLESAKTNRQDWVAVPICIMRSSWPSMGS